MSKTTGINNQAIPSTPLDGNLCLIDQKRGYKRRYAETNSLRTLDLSNRVNRQGPSPAINAPQATKETP